MVRRERQKLQQADVLEKIREHTLDRKVSKTRLFCNMRLTSAGDLW